MKPLPECRGCLEKLIQQTVTLATGDEILRQEAVSSAQGIMESLFEQDMAPAHIATVFHRKIKELTGNFDPFSEFKHRELDLAQELFEALKGEITPDLEGLIKFSVKGNALDFFRGREEICRDFHNEITFTINQMDVLADRLKQAARLLVLADNAGECLFDLPLVKYLSDSGIKVGYVVKGQPVQNDITVKDLEYAGLKGAFPEVLDNGSDVVGLNISLAGEAFRKSFNEADIIIAKGMGHYETLADNTDERLFFLLKAKCQPVAAAIGVTLGSYVLKNFRLL